MLKKTSRSRTGVPLVSRPLENTADFFKKTPLSKQFHHNFCARMARVRRSCRGTWRIRRFFRRKS